MLNSYLKDRVQQVVECGEDGVLYKSEMVVVSKGIPQGSILGPLLYIVYTNELPYVSNEYTVLYADDTSLIFSEKNDEMLLCKVRTAMDTLEEYFLANDLMLNVSKTQNPRIWNRIDMSYFSLQWGRDTITGEYAFFRSAD